MSSAEVAPGKRPGAGRLVEAAGWLALAALLVVFVPLFLCLPLTVDAAFYSVCARHILRGGALEKDFLFLPPPGMAWAVAVVRAVLGGSSVALRVADLLTVAASVWLLTRWLAALGLSRAARVWAAVPMFAFYLSTTEWCHCQPDVWMFLPALCALHLRRRRLAAGRPGWGWAVAEGVCWGAACLVKPFVVVPGALAWLVGAAALRRSGPGWPGRLLADAGGVLAGGLLTVGLWQLWLVSSGSWSAYWHNVADLRGDYYAEGWGWPARCRFLFTDLAPWGFLHALALPLAAAGAGSVLARALLPRLAAPGARAVAFALLSALYLGWMAQANFVQTQFNYHLVPTVLLALALVAGFLGQQASLRWGWVALLVFSAGALAWQPASSPRRLAAWDRCWREGNSAAVRDLLALDKDVQFEADAEHLEEVADYLRGRGVGEGDVLCFNLATVHLYLALDVDPPTRYLIPQTYAQIFPRHRTAILAEVRASGPRYVVTDMMGLGLRHGQALAERPGDPLALPSDVPPEVAAGWPYSERVVFRAGRYYVHQTK